MRSLLASILVVVAVPVKAAALEQGGVLSEASRKQSLLEYIAGREDLSRAEKAVWDKAVRLEFGGKAVKDGRDEGVTVAKSVISAAIFYEFPPGKAAKAAYAAYHDTYKWIPPPIAIDYQILTMLGKQPKVRAWDLAYDFPRHFNEDMAPDVVSWWDEVLAKGAIPSYEVGRVKEALAATKAKMKPMLLERLREGAAMEQQLALLEADRSASVRDKRELRQAIAGLVEELRASFRGVAQAEIVTSPEVSMYERLAAFAKEMGVPPPAPPAVAPGPVRPLEESPQPAAPARPPASGSAKPSPAVEAPLVGEPLVPLFEGWSQELTRVVDGWVGTPYLWGGTTKAGVDCSGFVQNVTRDGLGVDLPRSARPQAMRGVKVEQSELKKGDLVFFDTLDRGAITHVGIYMGDGKVAHSGCSKGVTHVPLSGRYYQRAYRLARRVLGQ